MVEKQSHRNRVWKWVAAVVIILIAAVAGIALYFSAQWKPILRSKIKEVVQNGSRQLYRIDFKDIHLNILTGSVTVDSISLQPDTGVFNAWKRAGNAPTHLFSIRLAKLQLRNISVREVYFNKKIEMNDIILKNPSINIIYNKVNKKPDTTQDKRSLYERISKTLKSVHIKGIKIENADFDYINGANGQLLNAVKKLNVQVKDFLLNADAAADTTRFYYTKDVSFELAGYSSLSKNKMYTTKVDTIRGSARGRTVVLKGLKMIPMYPDLQFSRMLKVQKDRYDLVFKLIEFSGVDFKALNSDGILHAGALKITDAEAKVFMNRELPGQDIDKSANFPHMALRRLPIQTTIDTLLLKRVNVAYTEYNPITQKRGTVHIDALNGRIMNVTNDSISMAKDHYAVAYLNAYMIKAAKLNIRINFDLMAKNAAFTFKGNIGGMDMVKLNPLSKALGLVEIEEGTIQKVDFEVKANAAGSTGIMHMYYRGLKVALLKEGEEGAPVKKKGLLSFLANTLIVKDANPEKGEELRTGKISFERPRGASFFNLLWKSVFVGMRETVGLGIVPMKSPEKSRKVIVDKMKERKEKREKRREERAERKAKEKGKN